MKALSEANTENAQLKEKLITCEVELEGKKQEGKKNEESWKNQEELLNKRGEELEKALEELKEQNQILHDNIDSLLSRREGSGEIGDGDESVSYLYIFYTIFICIFIHKCIFPFSYLIIILG